MCVQIILATSFFVMIFDPVKLTNLRLIGGANAPKDKFPYVVKVVTLVEEEIRSLCTGSVLSSAWTITAAHCISDWQIHVITSSGNQIPVKRAVKHMRYSVLRFVNDASVLMCENDVGLLNHEAIPLKQYGKISAVEYKSLYGQKCTALGYGLTNPPTRGEPLSIPDNLQFAEMLLTDCQHMDPERYTDFMCLVSPCKASQSTIILGDSGGPVVHASGIVAINSAGWTYNKTRGGNSGLVTPLSPYLKWIEKTLHNKFNLLKIKG